MDVLRHAGRAQLSGFAGGANKAMDAEQSGTSRPTPRPTCRSRSTSPTRSTAPRASQLQQDLDRTTSPASTSTSPRPQPTRTSCPASTRRSASRCRPWKGTDVIATASLVGGIFGKGGGGELGNAAVLNAAVAKLRRQRRHRRLAGLPRGQRPRGADHRARHRASPTRTAPASTPTRSRSPTRAPIDRHPRRRAARAPGGLLGGRSAACSGCSNALLVSGARIETGHPVTVFGPQVAYFVAADPDGGGPPRRPTSTPAAPPSSASTSSSCSAAARTTPGRRPRRARTSSTPSPRSSATRTGARPTIDSKGYLWKGPAAPIEMLERTNVITPNPADPSPPEAYTLKSQRTRARDHHQARHRRRRAGRLRQAALDLLPRGRLGARLRRLQHPVEGPRRRALPAGAADKIGFTFNWFYTDDKDIGYFNSGNNPERADGTDPEFPTWGTGQWDWQGWDPVRPEGGQASPAAPTPPTTRRSASTRRSSTRTTSPAGTTSRRRASAPPTATTATARSTARTRSTSEIEARIAGAAEGEPSRADRRDGGRRHGRSARQPGPALHARRDRQAPGGVPGD